MRPRTQLLSTALSPQPNAPVLRFVFVLITLSLLGGCATQRPMMPTPSVYAAGIQLPFTAALPEALRKTRATVFYATDRNPQPREDGRLDYGIGRSTSLAVGSAAVDIGGDATWEHLEQDARSGIRSRTLYLDIPSVTEFARTPEYPLPWSVIDGLPVIDAGAAGELQRVAAVVERGLDEQLANSTRKEILLYVHGVANTFDDALYTAAELWHYMGREFVPIAYTWPAGKSGPLRGYTYDRESSEFTVFHFKRFLDWLSRLPEVKGINIISHSRGTDVVSTGLRELMIEARASGSPLRERFKLRNVIMAAPDINFEIALMRTATEFVAAGAERITYYTSPNDKAIGIAEFLFGGGLRLGQVDFQNTGDKLKSLGIDSHGNQAVVDYKGKLGGAYGHNYFRMNPAVSSDLVLTVRYNRDPGAQNGRPLRHDGGMFWEIEDDYLLSAPKQ